MCPGCQGLRVSPKARPSVNGHCPSSQVFVLPTITAPAARSRRTASPSSAAGGKSPAQPNAVGSPATSVSSFTATGTPSSGRRPPAANSRSAASASASAASAHTIRKAFSTGRPASIRARVRSTRVREVTSPAASARADSARPGERSGVMGEYLREAPDTGSTER